MIESEILALSIFASLIITVLVSAFPAWLYKRMNKGFSLLDVVREETYPSLARSQFLAWTLVIIFCFTAICSIRFLSGNLQIPTKIPENLLALMGISAGVTATSTYVSKSKYGDLRKSFNKEEYMKAIKEKPFGDMLLENEAPSITRFQMFAWTGLSIFLYLAKFFATISQFTIISVDTLVVPDIETTFLVLMGVSQSAYLGGKWVAPSAPKVFNAFYDSSNKKVILNGANFGDDKKVVKLDNNVVDADKQKLDWSKELISFDVKTDLEKKEHEITLIFGQNEVKNKFTVGDQTTVRDEK
jgi:hypothetical protein